MNIPDFCPSPPKREDGIPHTVKTGGLSLLLRSPRILLKRVMSVCGQRSKCDGTATYNLICQASTGSRTILPQSMPALYSRAPLMDGQRQPNKWKTKPCEFRQQERPVQLIQCLFRKSNKHLAREP